MPWSSRSVRVPCLETVSNDGGNTMSQGGNAAVAEVHENPFENITIDAARPLAFGTGSLKIAGQTQDFEYDIGAPVNGRSEIGVRSKNGDELSPERSRLVKIGIACVAAWMAVSSAAKNAAAAIIPSGANDTTYVQNGASNAGFLLSLQATLPNGSLEHVSAFEINPWTVGTAAHNLTGLTGSADPSTIRIGTSPNFNNPSLGLTVTAGSYFIDPNYVPGSSAASTTDFAIIHLTSPLPDMHQTISITAPTVGQMTEFAGFGSSSQSGGTPVQDGSSRGWVLPVGTTMGELSPGYQSAFFSSTPGTANAFGGDSGGPVFSYSSATGIYTVYGEMVAQSGGTGAGGSTTFLDFADPSVQQFIAANTVPEPGTLAIFICAAGIFLVRPKRLAKT
jgi:hypothetical protein